jgi:uncharacterized FAD-dependent dehydrogenase
MGGEVLFNTKVTDLLISDKAIKGLKTADGRSFLGKKLILATGHSSRQVFEMLSKQKIAIEAKPFALGLRVEHSQELIDQIQYKRKERGPYLPPASYKLVKQVGPRGFYSFCMCPGGIIAPCATAPGEVVTNGWSPSKRNQQTSNSGLVVQLGLSDFRGRGPLSGLEFQQRIEQKAWTQGGENLNAPAQRMMDFVNKKVSNSLPVTSYRPGITSADLYQVLPNFISETIRQGLQLIGKNMPKFLTNEAVLHGVESRTSSPVRIPRDPKSLEHTQISGLYPCGEGAGYAGGIISAAIDGEKCAERAAS